MILPSGSLTLVISPQLTAFFTSALILRAFHEANGDLERKREVITTSYSHPANAAAAAVAAAAASAVLGVK